MRLFRPLSRQLAILGFGLGLAALATPAFVGDWKSYTPLHEITCLKEYGGRVYAGTKGGIRSIHPINLDEKVYDNLNGLLDVWITGFVTTDNGQLWAISHDGYLQAFDGHGFTAYGRSYVAERWSMNPRAVVTGGDYIVLGSNKGLTFFDTRTHTATVSLTRFGNSVGDSVLGLLKRDDTLYLSTPKAVYRAAIDWKDLLSVKRYGSIFDPRIWQRVRFPEEDSSVFALAKRMADSLTVENPSDSVTPPAIDSIPPDTGSQPPDTLTTPPEDPDTTTVTPPEVSPVDTTPPPEPFVRRYNQILLENGRIETYGEGTVLTGPLRVKTLVGKNLEIKGVTYKVQGWAVSLLLGERLFFGGRSGFYLGLPLAHTDTTGFQALTPSRAYPEQPIYNITAQNGQVFGQGTFDLSRLEGNGFTATGTSMFPSEEIASRNLRNLVSDANGDMYIGTWGVGLARIHDKVRLSTSGSDSCPFPVVAPNYVVMHSISHPYKNGVWTGAFKGEHSPTHQLAYFDTQDEKFTCFETPGEGATPHVIEAMNDSVLAVGSDKGLFLLKYQTRPASLKTWKTIQTSGDVSDTWGVQMDAFKRIWFIQGGKLAYLDSLTDTTKAQTLTPNPIESFSGSECRTLAADPARGFWAGCQNGLFHIVPAVSARDTRITRFNVEDGLLSNSISDVSVDAKTGIVWAATARGISRFEGGVAMVKTSLSEFKVYPNPFRKQHRFVIFDNLPSDAVVRIHGQDGQVVRTFHPRDMNGFQMQWDGTNEAGHPVTPGVYLWTVHAAGKDQKGRLIVAR